MSKPKLIIFDCDGTLVDSEEAHNHAHAALWTSLFGPKYDYDYCIKNLVGLGFGGCVDLMQEQNKQNIDRAAAWKIVRQKTLELLPKYTKVVPNIPAILELLPIPYCVASNSYREFVLPSLEYAGLSQFFKPKHIFTFEQVANPKPAPDLFIYSAAQMGGVSKKDCLVVEDSPTGVKAAVAAGMRVVGYTGVAHVNQAVLASKLEQAGAIAVIDDMTELWPHIHMQKPPKKIRA